MITTPAGGALGFKNDKLIVDGLNYRELPESDRYLPLETETGDPISLHTTNKADMEKIRDAELLLDVKNNRLILEDYDGKTVNIPDGAFLVLEDQPEVKVLVGRDMVATVNKKGKVGSKLFKLKPHHGAAATSGTESASANPFSRVALVSQKIVPSKDGKSYELQGVILDSIPGTRGQTGRDQRRGVDQSRGTDRSRGVEQSRTRTSERYDAEDDYDTEDEDYDEDYDTEDEDYDEDYDTEDEDVTEEDATATTGRGVVREERRERVRRST